MSDLALALWSFPVMLGMIFFLRIPVAAAMALASHHLEENSRTRGEMPPICSA